MANPLSGKYKIDRSSGCWAWSLFTDKDGYGSVKVKGKNQRAHRVSFEIANGVKLEPGQVVMHLCDNPSCVNPDHLRAGTQKENISDMFRKGRNPDQQGESNNGVKITEEQAIAVYTDSCSGVDAARKYGVRRDNVKAIRAGRSWRFATQHLVKPVYEDGRAARG